MIFKKTKPIKNHFIKCALVSALFLFGILFHTSGSVWAGEMTMHAMYVGRGDSILIESNGHYMLVDSGTSSAVDTILEYLDQLDIPDKHLDYIVATHPDGDHVGSFASIFEHYTVGQVIYSPCTKALASYFNFINAVKEHDFPYRTVNDGESWELGDAHVEVVYDGSQGSTYNECSIVLRVSCDGKSILLTGDLPSTMEHALMSQGYNFKADILKVGHHGAAASSCAAFLDAVAPQYAVISSSGGESSSLPKASVLKRLARRFIKTYRTTDGHVVIHVDDGVISTDHKENNGYISIKHGTITLANSVYYATSSKVKPAVTLTVDGVTVPSSQYTIKYSSNTYTGVGKVKLTGTDAKYISSCSTTFLILPQTEKLKGTIGEENSLTLSWPLQSHATGYTLVYTTDKTFQTGLKYITINNPKTITRTISKLEFDTNYYFKIRAYKTNVGYGRWSKLLNLKTPKPPKPEKQKITETVIKGTKVRLTWKKQTAKHQGRYILQYSTDKTFKKEKKITTIKIKKAATNTKVLKQLKKKKTYYFRIQGINEFGTGKWSKVKTVKIK